MRFAKFFRSFNPDIELRVIPFGDKIDETIDECRRWKFNVIEPNPVIDVCAKSIFKHKEYRPGVMAWRYMRKLNCLIDSSTPFVFMDINNLPIHNVKIFQTLLLNSGKDILLSGISAPKRTINQKCREIFDVLDESIGTGYNCSIISGKENVVLERDFKLLSNPNLIKLFNKAPEQGYLAFLLCISNFKHDTLKEHAKKLGISVGRSRSLNLKEINFNPVDSTFRTPNNLILLSYKTTGDDLAQMPTTLSQFVDEKAQQWLTEHC